MSRQTDAIVDWLGLRGGDPREGGRVPAWQGVAARTRWWVSAAWIAVGVAVFVVLARLVPDQDGVGGLLPLWTALLTVIAGLGLTERGLLRDHDDRDTASGASPGPSPREVDR